MLTFAKILVNIFKSRVTDMENAAVDRMDA